MRKGNKKGAGRYSSLLTGVILGYIVGFFTNGIIPDFAYSKYLYFGAPILFFSYLSIKKPRFTEYTAYAITIFVILQFLWDFLVGDRNAIRMSLFYGAILSLIINVLTGHVRLIGAKKTFRRAIGL